MPVFNGGMSALQRAMQKNKAVTGNESQDFLQRERTTPTAIGGIGMFNTMAEQNLQSGVDSLTTGKTASGTGASLGGKYGQGTSNPWEAFMSTSNESNYSDTPGQQRMTTRGRARGVTGVSGFPGLMF